MKLSISVPEQLWEEARAYRPDLSPSHLVQAALEGLAHSERTSTLAERPAKVDESFAAVRDRFIDQAHERFERGYEAAVNFAGQIDWWVIESLARDNFDVTKWADGMGHDQVNCDIGLLPKDVGPGAAVLIPMIGALGGLVSYPTAEEGWRPDAAYLRGFTQAMRALWTEVFERTPSGLLDRAAEDQENDEEVSMDEEH